MFDVRITLRVRPDQKKVIEQLALLTNRSEAEFIRDCVYKAANVLRKTDENGEQIRFPLDHE